MEVIGVGPDDLKNAADTLRQFYKVPLVSANIPGFKASARFMKNSGRTPVVVTSVMDPALAISADPKIVFADPIPALREIRRRNGDDLMVVIVYGDAAYRTTLIENCPGIGMIVDGLAASDAPVDDMGASPPIVANNSLGMYVAYTDYLGAAAGAPGFSASRHLRATVGQIEEDPEIKRLFALWINQKQEAFLGPQDQTDMKALISSRGGEAFAGSGACRSCHPEINRSWAESLHARAHESLTARRRGFDPDCLACHATGLLNADPGSIFNPDAGSGWMAGVQCEACHGPAAHHVKDPDSKLLRPVTENTCTRCHTLDKDPGFDYLVDVAMVNHQETRIGMKQP